MAGYRPAYTKTEEESMLVYIIEEKAYYALRGLSFWKLMAQQNFTTRTYQSLKEHFRKVMIQKLESPSWYSIAEDERKKILFSYRGTAVNSKQGSRTQQSSKTDVEEFSLHNYKSSDDSN